MPDFIPGLRLSELFYEEAVRPILARAFPDLRYAAARLGTGSEVLGFDTPRSTDHEWGPRLHLFVAENDVETYHAAIDGTLRRELPREIRSYPTNFGATDEAGVGRLESTTAGPVNHRVFVDAVSSFVRGRLGIATYPEIGITDWLTCSEQRLLEVTAGQVFHDGLGELRRARDVLRYYPHDVWLYLLAAQWTRISQMEAFVGRCGEVGDELGSALIAASLVRDLMRLCFLMERTYAPYPKWFGSAFARLTCASLLQPSLAATLAATVWPERERHLSTAYSAVAAMHNALGITEPLATEVRPYWGRPYLVIGGERFASAIAARITDPQVRDLPPGVGAVDQFVDSTDVLSHTDRCRRLRLVYEGE